jgi:hypothetical protein
MRSVNRAKFSISNGRLYITIPDNNFITTSDNLEAPIDLSLDLTIEEIYDLGREIQRYAQAYEYEEEVPEENINCTEIFKKQMQLNTKKNIHHNIIAIKTIPEV